MLAKFYNLILVNNTGYTQTYNSGARVSVRIMGWKVNSSGVLTYGTVATDSFGFTTDGTIADGASVELATKIDNSTDLNMGAHITLEVTTNDASTAGSFDLYIETCDANGSDWPSDQANFSPDDGDAILLGGFVFAGAETKARNFEI